MQYTVLFDVDNADGELMPQMTAQTSFITAQAQGVLAVPLAALQPLPAGAKSAADDGPKDGPTHSARVLRADGQIETRPVQVAVKNRHLAEVRSGLQEGERLVTGERPARSGPQRFKL